MPQEHWLQMFTPVALDWKITGTLLLIQLNQSKVIISSLLSKIQESERPCLNIYNKQTKINIDNKHLKNGSQGCLLSLTSIHMYVYKHTHI